MGIEVYGFEELRKRYEEQSKRALDDEILLRLSYIGEELCNHARTITRNHSEGGYDDRTGNLRSSIGYRIIKDGTPVKDSGFANVSGGNGETDARNALNEFSTQCNSAGWTLLIVAGMNYAEYVEAKGYNVLHLTAIEMDKLMNELKGKLWQ